MAEWREIAGYDGQYVVSDAGQVMSLKRTPGQILHTFPHTTRGYIQVTLHHLGKRQTRVMHRLVAETFLRDSYFIGAVVRHLDGIPANNHVSNLAWGTQRDNIHDMLRHGTQSNMVKTHCPQRHPYSPENTIPRRLETGNLGRQCRKCKNLATARRYRAKQQRLGKTVEEYRTRPGAPRPKPEKPQHDPTKCRNGHDLAVVGVHKVRSGFTCGQCGRDRVARYKAKKAIPAPATGKAS